MMESCVRRGDLEGLLLLPDLHVEPMHVYIAIWEGYNAVFHELDRRLTNVDDQFKAESLLLATIRDRDKVVEHLLNADTALIDAALRWGLGIVHLASYFGSEDVLRTHSSGGGCKHQEQRPWVTEQS